MGPSPAQDDLELSVGPIVALGPHYKLICKRLTKYNTSERVDTLSTKKLQVYINNAPGVYTKAN